MEQVGFWHFAHSYVRGNWANSSTSTFSLLAKCCHDVDLICWWMDCKCTQVSSFGSLNHFNSRNSPEGAAARCLDCAAEASCPYSARKIYLQSVESGSTAWPLTAVCDPIDIENVTSALRHGPYGRCVYDCDNDVCDNQAVNMQFANGAIATLSMVATTASIGDRSTRIFGSLGQLIVEDHRTVHHYDFCTQERHVYAPKDTRPPEATSGFGHGGADWGLMEAFVDAVALDDPTLITSESASAVASHLLTFEAEKSRLESRVVSL
uniref:Gfo/Idh/MocA-like oxidoreductase C-terminal domain-containing protein n=1 Tax=Eutreptiella gymnastica TaxID=73025 RepID=A0A7S4CLE1_9EUGL